MKKLINLIALVMLVSTNVLTPFSYAEVETPEVIPETGAENVVESGETPEISEESPELYLEDLGKLEQENQEETSEDALPDVQDDEESSVTDETEKVDIVSNEGDEIVQSMEEISEVEVQDENLEGGEAEDDFSLQKVDEFITMEVIPNTSVTLLPGTGFNETIKRLAGGSGATYNSGNSTITQIVQTGNISEGIITGEISEPDSEYPVYAYFTGGILYYTTQAETIYMNPDSSYMFNYLSNLMDLNISELDTSNVTNMRYIFGYCSSLVELDLSNFNTSNVTNMGQMFYGCSSLTGLDVSNFDTTRVTNMRSMFYGCSNLTELDVSHFDTNNVTDINYMFSDCINLTKLNLSNFNTSKMTNMWYIFSGSNNLQELDLSGWDFRKYNYSVGEGLAHNIGLTRKYSLKKLNFTNAKFQKDMYRAFYDLRSIEEIDLTNVDTSNVTSMGDMFAHCYDLETIYASESFVATGKNNNYMFENDIRLAGGNGTKYSKNVYNNYNSSYASKTYAKIDKPSQTGYFTERGGNMKVNFMIGENVYQSQMIGYGGKAIRPTVNPTKSGLQFLGWVDKNGEDYDFENAKIDRYTEIYAKFNSNEAVLLPGKAFNEALKVLAGSYVSYSSTDSNITQIIEANEIPSGVTKREISIEGSDYPVYARYDSGTIYYHTEAEVIYMNPDSSHMFRDFISLEYVDLDDWNTSKVINMDYMFGFCYDLIKLDLSNWDTSNVTGMTYMFSKCSSLTGLDLSNWDTSHLMDINNMFRECSSLTNLDLSSWDTSNVTNMQNLFPGSYNLTDLNLSGWDFRKYKGDGLMHSFFTSSSIPIKNLNMTNTKFSGSMEYAFRWLSNAENIKLDGINTTNVTNMGSMFYDCYNLTGLDLSSFNTSGVTNMSYMFYNCNKLENLDLSNFDVSKVTTMQNMFSTCSGLQNLNLDNWDVRKLTSYGGMFSSAYSLKNLSVKNRIIPERMGLTLGCEDTQLCASDIEIDVSNRDLSNTKDLSRLFANSNTKEIKGLDTRNTSTVTGMYYMFGSCKLTGLDLSSWDTSSVINMQAMFYGCNNLKTIYTSTGFVTNGVTYSNDMFNNNTNLVGGNGTKYNSSKTDKEYAKIDKPGQKGYFTEKGGDIFVRFMVGGKEYVTQTVQFGGKAIKPSNDPIKTGSQFVGWITKDGEMYDFDTNIKEYAELYAKFSGGNETILLPGYKFNETIKKLSGQSGATYSTTNTSINQIQQWEGSIPEGVMTMVISIEGSENPVYARYDNGTIYYHTEATKIYLNEDSSYMFYYCYGFTELDLSSRDTSSVTSMYEMFGYTYLAKLNLEGWDTSNVTNMDYMFDYSYYLTDLNMSGWDFRQINHYLYNIRYYYLFYYGGTLNLTNAKFAGDISWGFYYIGNGYGNVEKIILDGADVSEVTNMNALFYGLYDIKELDLSSWDTSKVTDMGKMFYKTTNLETIYVSTGFVTDQVTSSIDMFAGDTKLVGGNGTVYNSGYTDKEYAKIDKPGQKGYFTYLITLSFDSDGGTLVNSQKFKSGLTGTKPSDPTKIGNTFLWWHIGDDQEFDFSQPIFEPTQLYAKWQVKQYRITFDTDGGDVMNPIYINYGDNISVPNPTRNGYKFIGWEPSLPATMPAEDLSVKAKWEKNGSSGGGGGGGGSSTKPDTPKEDEKPSETPKDDSTVSSGTNVNDPENTTGSNVEIQTGSQVDSSKQAPQNDTQDINNSPAKASEGQSYSTEFQQAYQFAKGNGITTMPTIQKAQMNTPLTRIAMAKMLSQYAVNVLGKEPDLSKGVVKFNDVTNKMDKDYDDGVTLAYQLGIMGQNMPGNKFRPNDEVSRAEFATALSRLLYSTSDGKYQSTSKYYEPHMQKLKQEGIITNTDPKMKELRGYVMIMLMRSAK